MPPPAPAPYDRRYALQALAAAAAATVAAVEEGENQVRAAAWRPPLHVTPLRGESATLPQLPLPAVEGDAAAAQERVFAWLKAANSASEAAGEAIASEDAPDPDIPADPVASSIKTPVAAAKTADAPQAIAHGIAASLNEHTSDSGRSSVSVPSLAPDPTAGMYRVRCAAAGMNLMPVGGRVPPALRYDTGPRYRDGGGIYQFPVSHPRPPRLSHPALVADPLFGTPEQRYYLLTGSLPRWGPLGPFS